MDKFALVFRQLGIEELGIPAEIGPQGLDTGGPHVHVITSLGRRGNAVPSQTLHYLTEILVAVPVGRLSCQVTE